MKQEHQLKGYIRKLNRILKLPLNEVEILRSWKTKMDEGFGDLGSQEIKEVIENLCTLY